MTKKPLIAANWKMNLDRLSAVELAKTIKKTVKNESSVEVLICPSYTLLESVGNVVLGSKVMLGAQNLNAKESGAFTGEVSADMLIDLGCKYVIVGHSERRAMFGETNEIVNLKLKQSLKKGLKPILCIGETLEERDAGHEKQVIEHQLKNSIANIKAQDVGNIDIAYEPVWAIGTGRTAQIEQVDDICSYIKHLIKEWYNADVRVLYGGSVKPDNAGDIMALDSVDGCLVGGASLDAEKFSRIIRYRYDS